MKKLYLKAVFYYQDKTVKVYRIGEPVPISVEFCSSGFRRRTGLRFNRQGEAYFKATIKQCTAREAFLKKHRGLR